MTSKLNLFAVDAYIGLGSNLDDPFEHVSRAIIELSLLQDSSLHAFSNLYLSRPMGPADQPPYINAVAWVKTRLSAQALLTALQRLENEHHRTREGSRWGPRTLDLDILVYGKIISKKQILSIPHPGVSKREFVLYPLHEVNKNLMIPGLGTVKRLRANCYPNGLIRLPL